MYPGILGTTTPKEQGKNDAKEEGALRKEKADPICVIGKPPSLPPVLGPLVAFSLLETWMSRDGDDS